MIVSSDVPETDYTAWSSSTAYVVGNNVTSNHKNYECLVNNTNYLPEDNTGGSTPKWLDLGYDNRWKMFDGTVGSKTSQADEINITVSPGIIDSIAFLDCQATNIDIVMTDPIEGIVYTETIDLVNKSVIVDWYTYFFEPIITADTAILLGIPPYANAEIAITITYSGGDAEIGTLAFGIQKDIGLMQYNPTIGITDYSRKDTDIYGNYTVLKRSYSKRLSCMLFIKNSNIDDLHKTLAGYRAEPLIWVGTDDGYSSMIIYGFYKSFSIVIPYPEDSTCQLEIEGLT